MIQQSIDSIESKKDFMEFLNELQADYEMDGNNCNNPTIGEYLEAIQAWLNDSNDFIEDNKCWKFIATILVAGKLYE